MGDRNKVNIPQWFTWLVIVLFIILIVSGSEVPV